jgi:probable dihydroxyacetone kinase regulator
MEKKKKMTKVLIGESLKGLMLRYPFEKITIKMITAEASVIRPTFYNYFYDKYEVLEWIFSEDIIESVMELFDQEMYSEGLKLLFVRMKRDAQFYTRAFEITGQNSFENILNDYLYRMFMVELDKAYVPPALNNPLMTKELVARYYSISTVQMLKTWVQGDLQNYSADDMVEAFEYLLKHGLTDYLELYKK